MKIGLIFSLLAIVSQSGCVRPASPPSVIDATESGQQIWVDQVQVNQGAGVYVSGRSTLPNGECIQTELLADRKVVEWWPRDVCVTVDSGQWEILVALGTKNAPRQLESNVEYEIHAWWPKDPAKTTTRFPFDLSGPKP